MTPRQSTILIACSVALAFSAGAAAQGADWTATFEGIFIDVRGHDPLVLTILETDAGLVRRTGVPLETESNLAYRFALDYRRDAWGIGAGFFFLTTGQQLDTTASGGGVAFEVAGGTFPAAPGEVLFFRRLEDTDLNAWSFDVYGMRRVAGGDPGGLELRFGVRVADFDNDFRAAAGIEGIEGIRTDASSNYGAMRGPLIGLAGRLERGRSVFEGSVAQAVVLGEAELSNQRRSFTGAFSENPHFVSETTFTMLKDVAIPMTDVRLEWAYRLWRGVAVGVSANASSWWDVPVPPGAAPAEGDAVTLEESTLVFSGLGAFVEISF